MVANTFEISMASRQKVTWQAQFLGMSGAAPSTVPLDASTDPATTNAVMAGNANVGRIGEGGSQIGSPTWCREFSMSINNNLRGLEAVDSTSPVDIQFGECAVTGKLNAYFGDANLYNKFQNGTPSSLSSRVAKNGQATIFEVPRATYRGGGNPDVTGKNTDVMISLDYQASYDALTAAHVTLSRLEYVE